MARIKPYGDTSAVEKELNSKFRGHLRIKQEDVQVFAIQDSLNYLPVQTSIDSNGGFHIEDKAEIVERGLVVGSKKQFLYKRYEKETLGRVYNGLKITLDKTFRTAWDKSKYLVFKDGYLLSPSMYVLSIPTWDNDLSEKAIYFPYKLDTEKNTIDVFYIEHNDFVNVRFNQDAYIETKKAYCENKNQILVKVPYPNDFYPRDKKMFFVLDGQTSAYLDDRYDYVTADGAEYIVLKEDTHLVNPYKDYLTFVFPYVAEEIDSDMDDEDGVGEHSGVSFLALHSSYDPKRGTYSNPYGIVSFTEEAMFTKYDLTKEKIMLFCNSTFIEPDRYKLLNNNTIKLLRKKDVEHYEFSRFTMLVFAEKSAKKKAFDLTVQQVPIKKSDNGIYNVPKTDPISTNFLVFYDTLFFDISDRFTLDTSTIPNKIKLNSPLNDLRVQDGHLLTFVFYGKSKDATVRLNREIEICKINFTSANDGTANMQVPDLEHSIKFNRKNCIIFMNGTYLDPSRYTIDNNVLTFDSRINSLVSNKALTGIYLVSHPTIQDNSDAGYFVHDGMDVAHKAKRLIFDELYGYPKIQLDPNFKYKDPPPAVVVGNPWVPPPKPKPEPNQPIVPPDPKSQPNPKPSIAIDYTKLPLDEFVPIIKFVLKPGYAHMVLDGKRYDYLVFAPEIDELKTGIKTSYGGNINQVLISKFKDKLESPDSYFIKEFLKKNKPYFQDIFARNTWATFASYDYTKKKIVTKYTDPGNSYIAYKILTNELTPVDIDTDLKKIIDSGYKYDTVSMITIDTINRFSYKFESDKNGSTTVPAAYIVSMPPLKRNNGNIVQANEFPLTNYSWLEGSNTNQFKFLYKHLLEYIEANKIWYNYYYMPNQNRLLTLGIAKNTAMDGATNYSGSLANTYSFAVDNTEKSALEMFDYKDKKYASVKQTFSDLSNMLDKVKRHRLEVFTPYYLNHSDFPSVHIFPKFISGVPGSDGTHPLDIPLTNYTIYIKAWTGIKQP